MALDPEIDRTTLLFLKFDFLTIELNIQTLDKALKNKVTCDRDIS